MASPLIKRFCNLGSPNRLPATPKCIFKKEINTHVHPDVQSPQRLTPVAHKARLPIVIPNVTESPFIGEFSSPRENKAVRKLCWEAEIKLHQSNNQRQQNKYGIQDDKADDDDLLSLIDTPKKKSLSLYGLNMNKFLKTLGKGSFGTVIQARYKGEDVAVKVIPKNRFKMKSLNSLQNETNALILSHKNIVRVLQVVGLATGGDYGLVFMELCNGVSLGSLITRPSFEMTSTQRARYILDTAYALLHCHKHGILHLDVKPSNIIWCSSGDYCKLCDFGSSYNLENNGKVTVNPSLNTVMYTDPQILQGKPPSEKSDVYSLGVTSWQLLSCEVPYKGHSIHEIIYKVGSGNLKPRMLLNIREEDENYVELYKQCCHLKSECRPSMRNVIKELGKVLAEC